MTNKSQFKNDEFRNGEISNSPEFIRRYLIAGSRSLSNYWWASVLFLGGLGFFITGVSSFYQRSVFPFFSTIDITFFPQGLVMCFYGLLALVFSLYLWFTVLWSIGSGFNEFNKKSGKVRVFRWGFPGKNRRIDYTYPLKDLQSIKVEIKEGFTPRRAIYMRITGNRDILLTRLGTPLTLEEVETQAAELARFLQLPLEMVS
jgi:hypothetical protein